MNTRRRISLINKIHNLLEKGKRAYQAADESFKELAEATPIGQVITHPSGKQFVIVDNFAESNSAYRVARVNRLELKEAKKDKALKPKELVIERPQRGRKADIIVDEAADKIPGL